MFWNAAVGSAGEIFAGRRGSELRYDWGHLHPHISSDHGHPCYRYLRVFAERLLGEREERPSHAEQGISKWSIISSIQ